MLPRKRIRFPSAHRTTISTILLPSYSYLLTIRKIRFNLTGKDLLRCNIHWIDREGPLDTRAKLFFLFYFFKVFGGHMSFFGATGTPVLGFR